MVDRPQPYEQNREPTWELVEMLDGLLVSGGLFNVIQMNNLVPSAYDKIELTYTGSDLTGVVYWSGLAVVATLTLTYAAGRLTKVEKT